MTWFTTHLALEGLIVWIFIGKDLRSRFLASLKARILFLLANIMAIAPDLDVYIRIIIPELLHRGPSHSIIWPIMFLVSGYIIWAILWYKRRKNGKTFLKVLESISDEDQDWYSLLPYTFFLAAFYWLFHLILDMDSGEGGMMLLWPLDNQIYQIKFIVILSAFPFLFGLLPWTLEGIKLDVIHSSIQGLFQYSFNWTPDDFQRFFGSTTFNLALESVLLHTGILIVYIHFVVRAVISTTWIFSPFKHQRRYIQRIISKVSSFWHAVPKLILVPGFLFLIIGFNIGPVLGEQILDTKEAQGLLEFHPLRFNPLFQINFETANQFLDQNALQTISYNYTILTGSLSNISVYLILAPLRWFTSMGQQSFLLASQYIQSPLPENDTDFHSDYLLIRDQTLLETPPLLFKQLSMAKLTDIGTEFLPEQNSYGLGLFLFDWVSTPVWNETNHQISIQLSVEIIYERLVNYWTGIGIELLGSGLVVYSIRKRAYSS